MNLELKCYMQLHTECINKKVSNDGIAIIANQFGQVYALLT